jgi:hypothetical protein
MRKPFTKQEKQMMIEVVNTNKSIRTHAPSLAKAMGRSKVSVEHKMYSIKRELGLAPDRKKRVVKTRKPAEVVTQQQPAFSFNFKPTRTEVHQDHIRLYF